MRFPFRAVLISRGTAALLLSVSEPNMRFITIANAFSPSTMTRGRHIYLRRVAEATRVLALLNDECLPIFYCTDVQLEYFYFSEIHHDAEVIAHLRITSMSEDIAAPMSIDDSRSLRTSRRLIV